MTQDIAPARLLTDTWTLSLRNAINQPSGKRFVRIKIADHTSIAYKRQFNTLPLGSSSRQIQMPRCVTRVDFGTENRTTGNHHTGINYEIGD